MTALEWRSTMATWSVERLKRMRRLMLHELAPFLPCLASDEATAKLLFVAAPEAAGGELSQWRAILCGYVTNAVFFFCAHQYVSIRCRLLADALPVLCMTSRQPGSNWEHVTVQLEIQYPPDYPATPMAIRCVTPVFHPNGLCIDVLVMMQKRWVDNTAGLTCV